MKKRLYDKHRTGRVTWHSYENGVYFITICTKNRKHYFGEIVKSTTLKKNSRNIMQLSDIGIFMNRQIQDISIHHPYARIPIWTVMPNHIHLIVIIDGTKTPYKRRILSSLSLDKKEILTASGISNLQGWLSITIGSLKSSVTRFARQNNIGFDWQSRFYDHIIRGKEWVNIVHYIRNNIQQWKEDCFF